MIDVKVAVFFLMFKCYNTLNKYIRKISIHPAMRPVRRMVQCEGIVSLAMPCYIGISVIGLDIWLPASPIQYAFIYQTFRGYATKKVFKVQTHSCKISPTVPVWCFWLSSSLALTVSLRLFVSYEEGSRLATYPEKIIT